jgi:hypothetical protein
MDAGRSLCGAGPFLLNFHFIYLDRKLIIYLGGRSIIDLAEMSLCYFSHTGFFI